ncbi:MAG TPA: DUF1761 domain-containing protein [bacterium]|nr:DUF1761 domain-containing protein [bacterium]
MNTSRFHWPAVAVTALVLFFLGGFWYTAFANPWMVALGKTEADFEGVGDAIMLVPLAAVILQAVVIATVLSAVGARTAADGLRWGFFLWLGLIFATLMTHQIMALQPVSLLAINAGHELIAMLVAGAILGGWRPKGERLAVAAAGAPA